MFKVIVVCFSLCIFATLESASACNAISPGVAQLGNVLNTASQYSLGDVVVCAAEAATSNDRARKNYYLVAMTQIEAIVGDVSPEVNSALETIKAALLK